MGVARFGRGMVLSVVTKLGLLLASSALPLAKAAGSSDGPSLLETPTFTLAGVLFFFLLISLLFERSTHLLVWFFKKHNRQGLATAVQNLVTELTLIGFISLVLIVFQGKIHQICVPYSPDTYVNWELLHNVDGCDCCLANTNYVGYCFQQARNCGVDFCNCDGVDKCEAGEGLRRLLAGSSEGSEATTECAGNSAMELEPQTCSGGKAPLVSLNALHEVHLLIFCVAVGHVSLGVVMILLADLRMSLWRKWAREEDEHAQQVRKHLDTQSAGPQRPARKQLASRFASFRSFVAGRVHREAGSGAGAAGSGSRAGSGGASPAKPSSPSWGGLVQRWATFSGGLHHPRAAAAAPEPAESRDGGDDGGDRAVELPTGTRSALVAHGAAQLAAPSNASAAGSPGAQAGSPTAQPTLRTIPSAASLHEAELGKPAAGWQPAMSARQQQGGSVAATKGLGDGDAVDEEGESSSSNRSGSKQAGDGSEAAMPQQEAAAEMANDVMTNAGSAVSLSKASVAVRKVLRRQGTITTRHGWVSEWAICFLVQLLPSPISKEDFLIMRASFMLTHRVPKTFDFMTYIQNSMEDDLAEIVGVSVEMWLTIVIFVLISGLIGWPVLIFLVLAALIQTVTDAKLVQIMRHVCRGGRVNRLASNIFWRQKPPLLLIPIKFMLFFCSFIFSTTAFFAAVYGPYSCPLGGPGFWFAWSGARWWGSLIIAGYLACTLSFKTLPLYSLCVQMGSDFKSSMLPTRVREKLLFIAQHIKEKRRQQELAERQAAGGGSNHGLEGVQRAAAAVRDAGILLLSREPPKH